MEEIKKKNKKLKIIAVILFCTIVTICVTSIYAYNYYRRNISIEPNIKVMETQAREMFNSRVTGYIGKQNGGIIKYLLTEIEMVMTNYNKNITVIGLGDNEIAKKENSTKISNSVELDKYYDISMYYNEEGYINTIFIKNEGDAKSEEELKIEKKSNAIEKRIEEENEEIRKYNERDEKNKRTRILICFVCLIIIIALSVIGIIIIKEDDKIRKHKVLAAYIIAEIIIVMMFCVLFLFMPDFAARSLM